ncbi:conserved hypothetical protein [Trichinella spiralis]|uniref:hypothetical protein n=1 Tax=Trichinella spiralis TaxID=6334 RepID=UPI0001EFE2D9|nr:conserved hypothetical protein [Trichinella spiralis]
MQECPTNIILEMTIDNIVNLILFFCIVVVNCENFHLDNSTSPDYVRYGGNRGNYEQCRGSFSGRGGAVGRDLAPQYQRGSWSGAKDRIRQAESPYRAFGHSTTSTFEAHSGRGRAQSWQSYHNSRSYRPRIPSRNPRYRTDHFKPY